MTWIRDALCSIVARIIRTRIIVKHIAHIFYDNYNIIMV